MGKNQKEKIFLFPLSTRHICIEYSSTRTCSGREGQGRNLESKICQPRFANVRVVLSVFSRVLFFVEFFLSCLPKDRQRMKEREILDL